MRLLDLFNAYDKDKSGSITRDEFQKGLKVQKTTRTMQYYTDSITWWIAIIMFNKVVTGQCSLLNFHTIPHHSPRIFKLSQLFLMLWLISWMQMATVNWTTRYNTMQYNTLPYNTASARTNKSAQPHWHSQLSFLHRFLHRNLWTVGSNTLSIAVKPAQYPLVKAVQQSRAAWADRCILYYACYTLTVLLVVFCV